MLKFSDYLLKCRINKLNGKNLEKICRKVFTIQIELSIIENIINFQTIINKCKLSDKSNRKRMLHG